MTLKIQVSKEYRKVERGAENMDGPPNSFGELGACILIAEGKHKESYSPGVCSAWGKLHIIALAVVDI